jgi:hypothetical protein
LSNSSPYRPRGEARTPFTNRTQSSAGVLSSGEQIKTGVLGSEPIDLILVCGYFICCKAESYGLWAECMAEYARGICMCNVCWWNGEWLVGVCGELTCVLRVARLLCALRTNTNSQQAPTANNIDERIGNFPLFLFPLSSLFPLPHALPSLPSSLFPLPASLAAPSSRPLRSSRFPLPASSSSLISDLFFKLR